MLKITTKLAKNQRIFEDLVIKRKSWKGSKTGETYYTYLVKSQLRGMEVTINFRCVKNDPIMYRNLSLVFETSDVVYLMVEFAEDPRYNLFYAVSIDENGALGKAGIIPAARSDRDMLDNVIEVIRVRERKEFQESMAEEEVESPVFGEDGEPDEDLIEIPDPTENKPKKGKKAE
ncbi:MAG: hypothetical protein IJ735_00935 [Clostridia bacterium]|nr:hypothetical protein [Clostridia bacterium]